MLNGFENITEPLTDYELKVILPQCISGLKTKRGKSSAITNKEICEGLYKHNIFTESGKRISEVTIRKIINYIRVNDLIPRLVAGSQGYWIEPLDDSIIDYCNSLLQRINEIERVRQALLRQVRGVQKYKPVQERIFN